jgi:hypothetical protein
MTFDLYQKPWHQELENLVMFDIQMLIFSNTNHNLEYHFII